MNALTQNDVLMTGYHVQRNQWILVYGQPSTSYPLAIYS